MIPPTLRDPAFRFIPIARGEKGPRIPGWQDTACVPHNDLDLRLHLARGGNYGVVLGHGDLIVVDIDDMEETGELRKALPRTFTVQTGGGGLHYYYRSPHFGRCLRMRSEGGTMGDVGDIKAEGGQVVGPGSLHPSDTYYFALNNLPIMEVEPQFLKDLLDPYIVKRKELRREGEGIEYKQTDPRDEPQIRDMVDLSRFYRTSDGRLRGPHPFHGSDNGNNFSFNEGKNVWYCFRHGVGGSGWHLFAQKEGLLDCGQCGPGSIERELFLDLLTIAEDRGVVEKRKPKPLYSGERIYVPGTNKLVSQMSDEDYER